MTISEIFTALSDIQDKLDRAANELAVLKENINQRKVPDILVDRIRTMNDTADLINRTVDDIKAIT